MSDQVTEFEGYRPAIESVIPLIEQYADAADEQCYLPDEVALAMAASGLNRVAAARSVGGGETHPLTQIRVIEAIAEVDGATGWNLMIGIELLGIASVTFPNDKATLLFSEPHFILAGALNPLGRAEKTDGGYLVSGTWPFASGCHNATYFWGQCVVYEHGEKQQDDQGPVLCEALVARSEFEILNTWKVSGLRGSGSNDVRIDQVFVADDCVTRLTRRPPSSTNTLYRLPLHCRLAYNKVGVATGIARAAINHFIDLATEKTPRGFVSKLRERTDAQLAVAEAEYELRTARSFVFETVADVWNEVDSGRQPSTKQRAILQLACSGATTAAVNAVEKVYRVAGASANFKSNPLERCMRDVLVVRQHIMVSSQWTQAVGRTLLNLESGTFLF